MIICSKTLLNCSDNFTVFTSSHITAFLLQIYSDPLTGCKFFSKPEVVRYLKSAKCKSCSSKQKETCNLESAKLKSCSSKQKKTRKKTCSASKVCFEFLIL